MYPNPISSPAAARFLLLSVLSAWVLLSPQPAASSGLPSPALVIDPGAHLVVQGTTRLVVDCDLVNRGTFTPAPGSRVVVRGYGTPILAGVDSFADLELDAHGVATLANEASVAGTLRLGSGRLSLAGHDLTVAAISGGSTASYVMTPDTLGRLVRVVDATAPVAFPVGGSSFNPVTARTNQSAATFRVAALDDWPTAGLTPDAHLHRTWAIESPGDPAFIGDTQLTLQWNDGEQGPLFDRTLGGTTGAEAWLWNGSAWEAQTGVLTADNGSFPAVASLVSSQWGLWTLGNPDGLSAVEILAVPGALRLSTVWPNPVHGAGTVRYGLPRRGRTTVEVFSVRGERLAVLVNEDQDAGWHSVPFDSRRLASGVYFLRLQSGGKFVTNKVVVVR